MTIFSYAKHWKKQTKTEQFILDCVWQHAFLLESRFSMSIDTSRDHYFLGNWIEFHVNVKIILSDITTWADCISIIIIIIIILFSSFLCFDASMPYATHVSLFDCYEWLLFWLSMSVSAYAKMPNNSIAFKPTCACTMSDNIYAAQDDDDDNNSE